MTGHQVCLLCLQYDDQLVEKLGPHAPARNIDAATGAERAAHLRWMLREIPTFVESGRLEKAMRWLGFLQGVFWAWDLSSIETMKRDNAPADAVFDKERV